MKNPKLKLSVANGRINLTVWEKTYGGYNNGHTVSLSKEEAAELTSNVNYLIEKLSEEEQ